MYNIFQEKLSHVLMRETSIFSPFLLPCPQQVNIQLAFMAGPCIGYYSASGHPYDTYILNYSQESQVVEVGKDLPAQTMVNYSRLLRIMSSQIKQNSKDKGELQDLFFTRAFAELNHYYSKKMNFFSCNAKWNIQYVRLCQLSCPFTGCYSTWICHLYLLLLFSYIHE